MAVTLNDIDKELNRFDWTYRESDDYRDYSKGRQHLAQIRRMIKDYLSDHPNDKNKIMALSKKAEKKKVRYDYWDHKSWFYGLNESLRLKDILRDVNQ